MKMIFIKPVAALIIFLMLGSISGLSAQTVSADFNKLLETYYRRSLELDPLSATFSGEHRYDDQLANDISATYLEKKYAFDRKYLALLKGFESKNLNTTDKISLGNLKELLEVDLSKSQYHFEYMPVNQFFCIPLLFGQLGAGGSGQPFQTPEDYEKWLKRVDGFMDWIDTAESNMRKGMAAKIVLPKLLVERMIPQMESLGLADTSKNIFFNPVRSLPVSFTDVEKNKIREDFSRVIGSGLLPAYRHFARFLQTDYLPHAQDAAGLYAIADGDKMYQIYIRQYTTTNKTPEEIYRTGLKEVQRITQKMITLKDKVHFKGSLQDFFKYLRTDKRFMPFKKPEEVLGAYQNIYEQVKPHLQDLFDISPKNSFEIKRVEAFREASQNGPSYMVGSLADNRPGIFYVPVADATKINVTFLGMEATFLHEAIPGHHYQISLQMENKSLPTFRHQINFSAFTEGWALYVETLGKQLGCYQDPYQEMGALNNDIHRAIRLVTDVGIHTGKMTQQQAIDYMVAHESISKEDATLSSERYMGFPGQALSYKIGALEIIRIRKKCEDALQSKFNIKAFHKALLSQGDMPLSVLDHYMDDWVQQQL